MNPGVCPICRATYRSCEFSTDGIGNLVLDGHVCTPIKYRVETEEEVSRFQSAKRGGLASVAARRAKKALRLLQQGLSPNAFAGNEMEALSSERSASDSATLGTT